MNLHNTRSLAEIHGLLSPPRERREPVLPGFVGTLASRLRRRLGAALARAAEWRAARRALQELQAMDDRALADIGLTRGQVGHPAWRKQADTFGRGRWYA